jgi:hypothetical protein
MTSNYSLELSLRLRDLIRQDLLKYLMDEFPFEKIQQEDKQNNKRDRVYNSENTLLTMLMTSFMEDKSLQNSVNIFKQIFESRNSELLEEQRDRMEEEEKQFKGIKRKGRPRKHGLRIPKSKQSTISKNTAAYSKARKRLDRGIIQEVFEFSRSFPENAMAKWYGMICYILDGSYFQMQDTEGLRSKYYVKKDDRAYPQGLLEAMICQGAGFISDFRIGTRHQSELELAFPMLESMSGQNLILADDLYNCYAIFAIILSKGNHIIVPGKRKRDYTVIKTLTAGDQIVSIKKTSDSKWLPEHIDVPESLTLRRITYHSPTADKEYVLYTTILDEGISKADIIVKYLTRWDIEISIREIKTIMDVNIVRSKTEEMVFKEILTAFTAYNMVRKIIARSVQKTDFSPKENLIQEFFEGNKDLFIDKRGRKYKRWSPGRYGTALEKNKASHSI